MTFTEREKFVLRGRSYAFFGIKFSFIAFHVCHVLFMFFFSDIRYLVEQGFGSLYSGTSIFLTFSNVQRYKGLLEH
jgi:hypothetical protein